MYCCADIRGMKVKFTINKEKVFEEVAKTTAYVGALNDAYEKLFEDLVNSDEFMRYGIIKDYSNAISELSQVLKNNGPTEKEAQEIEGVIQELKKEMLDEFEKLQAEE